MKTRGNAYQNTKRAAVAPGVLFACLTRSRYAMSSRFFAPSYSTTGWRNPSVIRKLDRPPHLCHGPDDLAVDEVPESPDPHEQRRRNDKGVGQEQEGLPVKQGKEARADRATEHKPVGCHPSEPVGGNQPEMLTVERPFVERDLDQTAADEDANRDEQAQAPDVPE